ncbi:hypothetical protein TNCV_3012971 [Trichonephila clavipes]|nr:hypothetical protein TNCV_3012971 [Trichonephila clavipes]
MHQLWRRSLKRGRRKIVGFRDAGATTAMSIRLHRNDKRRRPRKPLLTTILQHGQDTLDTPGFTSCRNEFASIHPQRELGSFPHLPTQPEFKNSYCHHDVTMSYGNSSPLPHAHGAHRENSMAFCNWPRPYMPWKAPNAYSPCFYQNIDYCYSQPSESIKNYYPRFPYPTQPREYGYPPPAYDGRLVNRREKAESNTASQITESVFQGMEQHNTEPSDTEILNVVDVDETEDISQNNDVVGTESVKLEEEQSLTNNAVI